MQYVFGVIFVRLSDIATISRGVRVVRSQLNTEGLYPVYQNSMTPLGYYEKSNCPENTTFIIAAGAAGEIGYSRTEFWAADDCFYLECPDNLNSRYVYYALLCQQQYISSRVRRSSVPRLSRTDIESVVVPVPPLELQNRIVGILDRFDAICNDLTSGLPAEIEARQKQYEYYRDKLLTFQSAE
ncbi:restriction endonuclease subunit S [Lachnoclostridium sp. An131]|nr:restriction endonuclease subunit S [Lachnoclostridium sp. An131]